MNEDVSIIILSYNNQEYIEKTIKNLIEYKKKHGDIKQIIITDNASTDESLPKAIHLLNKLKDETILLITQPTKQTEKKTLIVALETVQTPITIILEAKLYTRLHQIQHQIKKLRKCDVVLPSRSHKNSKTKYTNNKEELKNKAYNLLTQIITGLEYTDINNPNKAFKTKKILPLLRQTKTKNTYWEETIMLAKNKGLRITETSTHWISDESYSLHQKNIFFTIKELWRIRRIKK